MQRSRYDAILITEEEAAQVERLTYVLSNTVKENLVARVQDWPGVHCAPALLAGTPVEGTWFDRKLEYNSRLRGKEPGPREFASSVEVKLSQLPCWSHLSPEAYRSRVAELVRKIEDTAAAARPEALIEPMGAESVRAQSPETRPRKLKKSPAPFVHAATKAARKAMWEAYFWFVTAYREFEGGRPGCGISNRELSAQITVCNGLSRIRFRSTHVWKLQRPRGCMGEVRLLQAKAGSLRSRVERGRRRNETQSRNRTLTVRRSSATASSFGWNLYWRRPTPPPSPPWPSSLVSHSYELRPLCFPFEEGSDLA